MYNKELNRKLIIFFIAILAVSLTCLGIRFPSANGISSSGKPKPRQRAIIKTQIKTCKQIIKKIPSTADVAGVKQIDYCPSASLTSLPSSCCCVSLAVVAKTLSRAPPQLS